MYKHQVNRLSIQIRGALTTLILTKTLQARADTDQNGQAVTLINTDVDSLGRMPEMLHETWAQIVEVILGIIILMTVVNWLWPIPILMIFGMPI